MTTTEETAGPAAGAGRPERGRLLRRVLGALAGLVAAGVALGTAELVAGLVGPQSSPVVAVGNAAVPLTPEPAEQFAIRHFGSHDKTVLVTGVFAVIALYALVVGLVALRGRLLGGAGVALFGVVGVVAAGTRPAGSLLDGLPSIVGAVAGVLALLALIGHLPGAPDAVAEGAAKTAAKAAGRDATDGGTAGRHAVAGPADEPVGNRIRALLGAGDRTGMDRRRFFLTSGIAVGAAVVTGGGGRLLQRRFDVAARASCPTARPAGTPSR